MAGWYEDNSVTIGRTPLVRLRRITDGLPATVLAKIEGRNPAYSVTCRFGAAMIRDADGPEHTGKTIVTVWPDSGERYLSSALFEGIVDAQGLIAA